MAHDNDNRNRCLFHTEKNICNMMWQKSSTACFFIWNLPNYSTCINVPNGHWEITHTQSISCCFMSLTPHNQDITLCFLPQFVAQNFIREDQIYSLRDSSPLCSLYTRSKDSLVKTQPILWIIILFKVTTCFSLCHQAIIRAQVNNGIWEGRHCNS